jgi:hypothetical protein
MSPAHIKDLVDLMHAQLVENMMTSISNSNQNMCLSFKKNRKTLRKELVKPDNKENQVIEQMGD